MKALLGLFWHELREGRALLIAAAVASVLPLLAPLLATTSANSAADIREVAMWVMAGCLVPLFALLLGVNFIGSDLKEGRLGFFFAQPLSGPTIWFAKLAAAVLLLLAAQLMMMFPTALLSGDAARIFAAAGLFFEPLVGDWASSVTVWVAPVAVILVSHALGLVWRARSAWVVVDLIAIALLVVAVRWVISPFLQIFAAKVVVALNIWLALATLIGLAVAGAFQLTSGRVDARRGHRVQSAVLWSTLAIAVAAAAGWGSWVRSARPGDLDRLGEMSVSSGDWIAVTGPSAGRFDYYPGFLLNTSDGRWVSAHSGSRVHERGVEFSADMSRAVWTTPYSFKETKLMTVDLSDEHLRPVWTGVVFERKWRDLALSPTGHRVAVIHGGAVTVYDIGSGDLLIAGQISGDFFPYRMHFADENRVEVLAGMKVKDVTDPDQHRMKWRRYELDLTARELDEGVEIRNAWRWWSGRLDAPIRNAFERREVDGRGRLFLVDLENQEDVADLGEMPKRWSDVRVVAGDRIVVSRDQDDEYFLEVFTSEGEPFGRITVADAGWIRLGGEVTPGRLAVGQVVWGTGDVQPARRSTVFADLPVGAVVGKLDGVSPILGRWGLIASHGAWEAGAVATRLMEGRNGTLHLWDPDTGELEQIIPVVD